MRLKIFLRILGRHQKLDSLRPGSREMKRGRWQDQNFQPLKEVQRLEEEEEEGEEEEEWEQGGGGGGEEEEEEEEGGGEWEGEGGEGEGEDTWPASINLTGYSLWWVVFYTSSNTCIETCTQTFVNILYGAFQYVMNIKGKKHVMQSTEIPQYIIICFDTHKTF